MAHGTLKCSLPVKEVYRFIQQEFKGLETFEHEHQRKVHEQVAYEYRGREDFDPKLQPPASSTNVSYSPDRAEQLVFSAEGPKATRRGYCMQVHWEDIDPTSKPKILCVKIHVTNATLTYPVGSMQDRGYRAQCAPTYFSSALFAMFLPAIPPRCPKPLIESAKTFTQDLFFNSDEPRAAVTAELYYILDNDILKRVDERSSFRYSMVKIDECLVFDDEDLVAATDILKRNYPSLSASTDYNSMKKALCDNGFPDKADAYIALHLSNLASQSLEIILPSEVVRKHKPSAMPQKSRVYCSGGRPFHLFLRSRSGVVQPIEPCHFEAKSSPIGVLLISEFSKLAIMKMLAHPVLRRFVITSAYSEPEIEATRAALNGAADGAYKGIELTPSELIECYEWALGIQPEISARFVFANEKEINSRARLTHPGRDYVHLLLLRLLCLWIDEQNTPPEKNQLERDSAEAEKFVSLGLFGGKCDSFVKCSEILKSIDDTMHAYYVISDASDSLNTQLLLMNAEDQGAEFETHAIVENVAVDQNLVTVRLPVISSTVLEECKLGKPVVVKPIHWTRRLSPMPLPPLGATLPVLVRYDNGVYVARLFEVPAPVFSANMS